MTAMAWLQIALYLSLLLATSYPLGLYMARVYDARPLGLVDAVLGPLERFLTRLAGARALEPMNWRTYAAAMLAFNTLGLLVVYGMQRLQDRLPANPNQMTAVAPDSALNTAISFASNTNWQGYGGETTMSYGTQALGLTVQNFLSAATGMAILVALIRGLRRRPEAGSEVAPGPRNAPIGNFWFDLTRSTLYILLPLSLLGAKLLASQGVVQTWGPAVEARMLDPATDDQGREVATQKLALGPAASQIAIKQLGTNGGGFFNVNSAHPFENPTPIANWIEALAILLIPAGLCFTFGEMVGDRRQAWALLAAMLVLFVPLLIGCVTAEQAGAGKLAALGVDDAARPTQAGGHMEGKEVRNGIVSSALWAAATTAASNGSVNSMHDSYTPLGGLVPMALMQLGEVVFGGVGSGLYGLLIFALLAVFVAGLMVGRTPEYLGKKIEAFEIKMASLVILLPPATVLLGTALAVAASAGRAAIFNPGAHGFSEMLYAFSSAGNNNGSAFAGLNANTPFLNIALGIAMLVARYGLAIPTLAIAGSLAAKRMSPPGVGTLPTHTPLFVALLASVVVIVGALTFLPALALGPIVEQLQMTAPR